MKIRNGYVGNSSSCSFIIDKKFLTQTQIYGIINHGEIGKELGIEYYDETWQIWDKDDMLVGDTGMDNFSMEELCEKLGIPKEAIEWDTYNGYRYGKNSNRPSEVIRELLKTKDSQ